MLDITLYCISHFLTKNYTAPGQIPGIPALHVFHTAQNNQTHLGEWYCIIFQHAEKSGWGRAKLFIAFMLLCECDVSISMRFLNRLHADTTPVSRFRTFERSFRSERKERFALSHMLHHSDIKQTLIIAWQIVIDFFCCCCFRYAGVSA